MYDCFITIISEREQDKVACLLSRPLFRGSDVARALLALTYINIVVSLPGDVSDGAYSSRGHHDLVINQSILPHTAIDITTRYMTANLQKCKPANWCKCIPEVCITAEKLT